MKNKDLTTFINKHASKMPLNYMLTILIHDGYKLNDILHSISNYTKKCLK
jgi:hypothetical protein